MVFDNLSAHRTKTVAAFLDEHHNVTLHFAPTYWSWLNQVELWFSKVPFSRPGPVWPGSWSLRPAIRIRQARTNFRVGGDDSLVAVFTSAPGSAMPESRPGSQRPATGAAGGSGSSTS